VAKMLGQNACNSCYVPLHNSANVTYVDRNRQVSDKHEEKCPVTVLLYFLAFPGILHKYSMSKKYLSLSLYIYIYIY